ncbi:Surface membrane protein [Trypanosoma cruzi]|uniref:Surface membrane protein n=1 Tax=Trypanosoma cruzi TaxID=5693 RepID=A0A2V2UFY7_TRYCR|nr:Surface membrane protein [Trypanosoma cruzi]
MSRVWTGPLLSLRRLFVPVSQRTLSHFPVSVNVRTVTPFNRMAPFNIMRKSTYSCSSSDCKDGKDCKCKRDVRSFGEKCTARGGIYNKAPTWCEAGHICGECLETLYLRQLYLVVREVSNGKYAEDTNLRSAMYAFGDLDNDYQPGVPSTVTVRLYSSKDPYIALQRLTKGTNDLGLNSRTVGIVLIVLGCLFLLLENWCLHSANLLLDATKEDAIRRPALFGSCISRNTNVGCIR